MKQETISELTKKRFGNALFDIMRDKPLDKISVREISERCEFPRSTFYYHFDDIYDLAAWVMAVRTIACMRQGAEGHAFLWGDSILTLFNAAKGEFQVFRNLVSSKQLWRVVDAYALICVDEIVPELKTALPEARDVDTGYLRFLTLFYGHAMLDTCVRWLRGEMVKTPEEMAKVLDGVIYNSFMEALRRAEKEHSTFEWKDRRSF